MLSLCNTFCFSTATMVTRTRLNVSVYISHTISQIIQLGEQFCLIYLFMSLFYMFRASKCPSSGENYCLYAALVFVTLYGWRLVCWLNSINPTSRPDATHTEWQIPVLHRYSILLEITNRCNWMQWILFLCLVHSTCFGRHTRPSSGVQLYLQPLVQS